MVQEEITTMKKTYTDEEVNKAIDNVLTNF